MNNRPIQGSIFISLFGYSGIFFLAVLFVYSEFVFSTFVSATHLCRDDVLF